MNDKQTCETCRYFEQGTYDRYGFRGRAWGKCRLTLPPWVLEESDFSRDVLPENTCDLHKAMEVQP